MGESALVEALITGFIGLVVTAATAGGIAAYTFRSLVKTSGDLADRLKKTIDERDEESKAKIAEMEARATLKIELANAVHEQSTIRNELTVVASNATKMDEAVRLMGVRLSAIESEKAMAEKERDELKAERDELKAERDGLKVERDELREQIGKLQAQIDELKNKVNALEASKHLEDVLPKEVDPAPNINPTLVLTAPDIAIRTDGGQPS